MKPFYLWTYDHREGVFIRKRGYKTIDAALKSAVNIDGHYQIRDRYNYVKEFN